MTYSATISPLPTYQQGSVVRLSVIFTDPFNSDAVLDPSNVYFSYRTPAGVTTTYTYGVDILLVRDSAGYYHYDLLLDAPKLWTFSFWSTGPLGQSSAEASLRVLPTLSR